MTIEFELRESVDGGKPLEGSRWRAKIIAADTWGSSAYYPADVLERDGARVFTKGLQMFQDHASENEEWERPEGSLENLVGKLESDAIYEAEGEDGPGLYADVAFYPSYVERIKEIGKDVGLSVRASGLTEDDERDGRYGPVLVGLLSAKSVDVVTKAGAGGKLTSILESDRELAGRPITKEGTQSVTDVTKEDFETLSASIKESISGLVDSLKESLGALAVAAPVVEIPADENKGTDDEVKIDHAAIVEALRENELPAATASAVVRDMLDGADLETAIKTQTTLREAFVASNESGTVVRIQESAKDTGLAYALKTLG